MVAADIFVTEEMRRNGDRIMNDEAIDSIINMQTNRANFAIVRNQNEYVFGCGIADCDTPQL
jgi:c-di-AMP phosphodiesterase-like protein